MRIEKRTRVEISIPVRSDLANYQLALDWLADDLAFSRGGVTITTPFSGLFFSSSHAELISDAVRIVFCDFELDFDSSQQQNELLEYLETTKTFLMEMLQEEEIWVIYYAQSRCMKVLQKMEKYHDTIH